MKKTSFSNEPKVIRSPTSEGPKISKSFKTPTADSEVRQSKIKMDEVHANLGE